MSANDDAELDRQLQRSLGLEAPQLKPAPAFTRAVMARVHADAEAPAAPGPLAFPWTRALPGLAAGCLVLGLIVAVILMGAVEHLPTLPVVRLSAAVRSSLGDVSRFRLGWLSLALLIALLPLSLTGTMVQAKQRTAKR